MGHVDDTTLAFRVEKVRLEKFDGGPPTKMRNAIRRVAGLGPKQPVEVLEGNPVEGMKSVDVPELPKRWVTYHLIRKFKEGNTWP